MRAYERQGAGFWYYEFSYQGKSASKTHAGIRFSHASGKDAHAGTARTGISLPSPMPLLGLNA